jgi:CHRD domain
MLRPWTVRGVLVAVMGVGLSVGLAQVPVHGQVTTPDPLGPTGQPFDVTARLRGFQETPALSTRGRGDFKATVTRTSIQYELSYSNLEAPALVAHIHFGQRGVAGGISAFLCGGAPPQSDKPPCPPAGTVRGTITAADVIGPDGAVGGQGIEPGQILELVRAMRAGVTYANVHSTQWPAGEIRGQIHRVDVPPPLEETLDDS